MASTLCILLVQPVVRYGPLFTVIVVSFARSAAMQTRSFSVVGPKTWNGLTADLRHLPNGAYSQFHHLLKTVLSAWPGSGAPLSLDLEGGYINFD